MSEIEKTDKQDSIELSRTAKGDYSWKIKIYYDEEKRDWMEVLTKVDTINTEMLTRFNG